MFRAQSFLASYFLLLLVGLGEDVAPVYLRPQRDQSEPETRDAASGAEEVAVEAVEDLVDVVVVGQLGIVGGQSLEKRTAGQVVGNDGG